jgi:hypothetical protein
VGGRRRGRIAGALAGRAMPLHSLLLLRRSYWIPHSMSTLDVQSRHESPMQELPGHFQRTKYPRYSVVLLETRDVHMLDGDSGFCVMASGTTDSVHHIHLHYCTRSFLSAAIHRGTYVSMPSQTRRYASTCDRGGLAGRRKKRAAACLQCPLQTLASGCLQTCPLPFSLLTRGMYYGLNTLRVVCRNPPEQKISKTRTFGCERSKTVRASYR